MVRQIDRQTEWRYTQTDAQMNEETYRRIDADGQETARHTDRWKDRSTIIIVPLTDKTIYYMPPAGQNLN